ncbi:MAG: ABC transporter permease subunit [Clostridia bacterium]|nr:ABC transporter permease subunit [Clostridia bacterium]
MKFLGRICRVILIAAFWIGVWTFASWKVGKPLLFPSPAAVIRRLFELMQTKDFYLITVNSLWNIVKGILAAVFGGSLLAMITSRIRFLREAILPVMTVIKATPVASFIILALIWIGSAKVPTFITVLIVLPVIWTNLDEGLRKVDPQLVEVAKVYKMPLLRRLRLLTLPSVKPYFVSACRTSLGLAWKAGIAAEIIAMPRNSIGTMIGDAKQYIMTEDMFAWTLTVILLSLVIEFLFAALFNKLGGKRHRKETV